MQVSPRNRNDPELVRMMLPKMSQGMGKAPNLRRCLLHIRLALPPLISTSHMRGLTPLVYTLAKGLEMNLVPLGAITTRTARVARLPAFQPHMVQVAITMAGSLTINPRTTQLRLVEAVQTLVHHSRARTIHLAHQYPIATINLKLTATITLNPMTITLNKVAGGQNAGALVHQGHQATPP